MKEQHDEMGDCICGTIQEGDGAGTSFTNKHDTEVDYIVPEFVARKVLIVGLGGLLCYIQLRPTVRGNSRFKVTVSPCDGSQR